jgi:hypothetical protein
VPCGRHSWDNIFFGPESDTGLNNVAYPLDVLLTKISGKIWLTTRDELGMFLQTKLCQTLKKIKLNLIAGE